MATGRASFPGLNPRQYWKFQCVGASDFHLSSRYRKTPETRVDRITPVRETCPLPECANPPGRHVGSGLQISPYAMERNLVLYIPSVPSIEDRACNFPLCELHERNSRLGITRTRRQASSYRVMLTLPDNSPEQPSTPVKISIPYWQYLSTAWLSHQAPTRNLSHMHLLQISRGSLNRGDARPNTESSAHSAVRKQWRVYAYSINSPIACSLCPDLCTPR